MMRLLRMISIFLGISLMAIAGSAAMTIKTPQPGSAERVAILDAMRPQVEAAMRGPVVFVIDTMNVAEDWAFVIGYPQRPDGSAIDPSETGYASEIDYMDGLTTIALLRFANNRWNLIDLHTGATDASFTIWPQLFGVPGPIVGMAE